MDASLLCRLVYLPLTPTCNILFVSMFFPLFFFPPPALLSSSTFTCNLAFLFQPFYLLPPSPLLAGRLGGDKFGGGRQREDKQGLCVST